MSDTDRMELGAISERELEPVLKLLRGGDPDVIAEQAGMSREHLLRLRDALLARVEQEKAAAQGPLPKVGRNDPCPCGSGKKYKHCCLRKHEQARLGMPSEKRQKLRAREREQKRLIEQIESSFNLLGCGRYAEAIRSASKLLKTYPNEDRLHDIVATSNLYAGNWDRAIEICRKRWEVATEEKEYFIKHGGYRDAEVEKPALSYYYPPMTWLQKQWVALKARQYASLYPESEDRGIVALVNELQSADDAERFPEKRDKGYEVRREALAETLERLKAAGPEVIPYLLPLACRYCWASLFVPEILAHSMTELAVRALIDISMFGFAYVSGASLHYLEQLGEEVISYIREAFGRDRSFDPIKTGIVSVLGNIRVPASYKLLVELLEHESPHIVNWAGGALGKFGQVEALPRLLAAQERIGGEKMIDDAIEKLEELRAGQSLGLQR